MGTITAPSLDTLLTLCHVCLNHNKPMNPFSFTAQNSMAKRALTKMVW
jgi:hypothetical protein